MSDKCPDCNGTKLTYQPIITVVGGDEYCAMPCMRCYFERAADLAHQAETYPKLYDLVHKYRDIDRLEGVEQELAVVAFCEEARKVLGEGAQDAPERPELPRGATLGDGESPTHEAK